MSRTAPVATDLARSLSRRVARAVVATLGFGGALFAGSIALSTEACGAGSYYCDSTSCYQCDGYGCHTIASPTLTPCAIAGDPACIAPAVCTSAGCADACTTDAQCAQGLVCNTGYCVPPGTNPPSLVTCSTASDCGADQLCVNGACVNAPTCTGAQCACKYSSDCGTGRICVDSQCVPECTKQSDCPQGLLCLPNGYCAEGPTTDCGPRSSGKTCAAGQICVDAHCVNACATSASCLGADGKPDPGLQCVGGGCVVDPTLHVTCHDDTNCIAGKQICLDGLCRYTCASNTTCLGIDSRLGTCSKSTNVCMSSAEASAQCTVKSDCGSGKDCVDGSCK
ncbi:MAG: hypothetical protein ACHREM_25330 [Polyangiales bacterium]